MNVQELLAINPYARWIPECLRKPNDDFLSKREVKINGIVQGILVNCALTAGLTLPNNWILFGYGAAGGGGLGTLIGMTKECASPSELSFLEELKASFTYGVALKTSAKVAAVALLTLYTGGVITGTYFLPTEFSIFNGAVLAFSLGMTFGSIFVYPCAKVEKESRIISTFYGSINS